MTSRWSTLGLTLFLAAGCGSSTSDGPSDAGTGGAAASGGSGAGGSGGGSSKPHVPVAGECTQDADCELGSSCCDCRVAPVGKLEMPYCEPTPCFADRCSAEGIQEARCIAGQCSLARKCNPLEVACDGVPPECPPGQVPSVEGGCWGGCVEALQCDSVGSCADCPSDSTCVTHQAFTTTFHCVNAPASCSLDCTCLGAKVCIGGFSACTPATGTSAAAVNCECPAC
ncbi:MAG: hypothetical protein KF718_20020 [Polyangiaceae bacterium]|nr:hypothetical protein [Polyangiaceae bacterium]